MTAIGRAESDRSPSEEDFAAAGRDPAARWRAIEACRDYLRLVTRRGRLCDRGGVEATSDLVQATCVEGWRQFSRFQGQSPGELCAWLRAILIHASLNARQRPFMPHVGSGRRAGTAQATAATPGQVAQDGDSREALDAALARLPDRHRSVIHLRLWDRLSFAEIGRRMGLTEDAARMLYGRALEKLRGLMRSGHDPG